MFDMDTNSDEIRVKLDAMATQLVAIYRVLDAGEPALPAKKSDWIERRICLLCEKQIASKDRSIRGCHERCYRKTKRRLDAGDLTENEAITAGFLSPKRAPGKSAELNALTEYLNSRDANQLAAEAKENYVSDN